MKNCRRSVKEQRYIWAALQIWSKLPEKRRAVMTALIDKLAVSAEEGRALFEVLVKEKDPDAVSRKTMVTVGRIYELKREFYEQAEL